MSNFGQKKIPLRVLRMEETRDAYKSVAKVNTMDMRRLEATPGSIVLLRGGSKTAVKLIPDSRTPEGTIRIDGMTRENASVRVDDSVEVTKVDAKPARKVTIAPTRNLRFSPATLSHYIKRILLDKPITTNDKVVLRQLRHELDFLVVGHEPRAEAVVVDRDTTVDLLSEPREREKIARVTWEDIGDLKRAKQKIRELVELPLRFPELFTRLGIEPPKGILLHGPPGTGKTLLARVIANETDANFIQINGPEIMSKWYGESERRLRKIFKKAEENAPSIIFIDEIDAISPKRGEIKGEVEKRVVSQLLGLMDGLQKRGKVIVIGATNRVEDVDPALRRPGRFDREIETVIPSRDGREEILRIHTRGVPFEKEKEQKDKIITDMANVTHGYSGADLEALVKEAAMSSLRRNLPSIDLEKDQLSPETLRNLKVTRNDFKNALREVKSSGLREIYVKVPNVYWKDIGGLEEHKQKLKEMIQWPLKYPKLFDYSGVEQPTGILLYGPPGCGKTMLAKAVATESEANFLAIRGPEVLSKWVGESEKAVREIFKKARTYAPAVIFFDEIDSIAPKRGSDIGTRVTERVVSQLLTEMDGIEALHDIAVIGATNRPDLLDPALLRPGRFDRLIEVPMPELAARKEIFKIHLEKYKNALKEDIQTLTERLSNKTEDFSGADIESVCREATMAGMREFLGTMEGKEPEKLEGVKFVEYEDFIDAIQEVEEKKERFEEGKRRSEQLAYL